MRIRERHNLPQTCNAVVAGPRPPTPSSRRPSRSGAPFILMLAFSLCLPSIQMTALVPAPASSSVVFFDIAIGGAPVGRLTFGLAPTLLPSASENIRVLCSGERTSIDQRLSYVGCEFVHSPSAVEGPQYRWSHVLKGRGRCAAPLDDAATLARCRRTEYGGDYYGLECLAEAGSVALTVPIQGPGSGTSRIVLCRVGDSPPAWRQRLLLNSAVVGVMVEGQQALRAMATARQPPVVSASGVLERET